MRAVLALALIASASAFMAPALPKSTPRAAASTVSMNTVQDMPGVTAPVGYFDPVGYSEKVSPEAMCWFRAAELKHSRVAMLAFTGWTINGLGWHLPGYLSIKEGVTFESLSSMAPRDAWAAVPENGKNQIIGFIFVLEIVTELIKPHYTKAGKEPYPPMIKTEKYVDATRLRDLQDKELNNGRLAMIGMMGFSAAATIPGSVPFLP
jgi:hypothetical protein